MLHRVRWSECDPFRHANHRAYFEGFEEARDRYLEAVGLAPFRRIRRVRSSARPASAIIARSFDLDRPRRQY
jgi:acyl-CoA thioesterase FadM